MNHKAEIIRARVAGPRFTPDNCDYCEYDRRWLGHGGYVYMGNNGPITPCPVCNPDGKHPRKD